MTSHRTRAARTAAATMLVTSGVVAFSALTAQQALAAPPSLTGQFLAAGTTSGNGGSLVTTAACSQVSASTIAFTATGTSGLPYPGTFTMSGVVAVTDDFAGQFVNGVPLNYVSALDTFFTINSPVGDVTGSTNLTSAFVLGLCETYDGDVIGNTGTPVSGYFREVTPDLQTGFGMAYEALVVTTGGTYLDTGNAGMTLIDLNVSPEAITTANVLNAGFVSDGLTPVTAVGASTGGGQIRPDGRTVSFGFEAKSQDGHQGHCTVVDQTAGVAVRCTDVTSWLQLSATAVRFSGHATVNGVATTYTVDTQDVADPGSGTDTFRIVTGSGYTASGTLARGNVQIHRR